MKINVGNYEILDSGTVISFDDEPVVFHVSPEFKVIFTFPEDTSFPSSKLDFEIKKPGEMTIKCINFKNDLGLGNILPLNLGTIGKRAVYLNFRCYTLGQSKSRTLHYTWYLREEVPNA